MHENPGLPPLVATKKGMEQRSRPGEYVLHIIERHKNPGSTYVDIFLGFTIPYATHGAGFCESLHNWLMNWRRANVGIHIPAPWVAYAYGIVYYSSKGVVIIG
jgi:hypothetical protein